MIDHDVRSPMAESIQPARHRVGGDGRTGLVLGAALLAMATVAGLTYTFSVAVMPNLARADDRSFVATMQRFNANPAFVLTFTAALVLTALAVVLQRRHRPGIAVRWTVAALVLYGIVLAVTVGISIPLNEKLDRAGNPDTIADLAHLRNQFEGPWVAANIVRTLVATAAVVALARAVFLHGRATAGRDRSSPSFPPPRVDKPSPPGERSIR
jgi:uncharacterized membrane protein